MNYRMISYVIGFVLKIEAALMALALAVALIYGEQSAWALGITMGITLVAGFLIGLKKPENKTIHIKEGLITVALSWIVMSLFGTLPFFISGTIPSYLDGLFEVVSGFTTTGASILTDIEILPKGILFWRSLTHWLGGMGILVFVLTILPISTGHSLHLMRAESPGPETSKLVPNMAKTAKILYSIYFAMTVIEIGALMIAGMSLYDAAVHAFGTAGTGGFSVRNLSIAAYDSVAIDTIITVFMILFGVNFSLYYLLLAKNFKQVFKSEELRIYIITILVSMVIITINILPLYSSVIESVRYSTFQVGSIITTTGYATTDTNIWPQLSKTVLILLMFFGASAGSTGGGLKAVRVLLLFKSAKRDVGKLLYPNTVKIVSLDNKKVSEDTISGVKTFFFIYMMITTISILLVSLNGYDLETSATAVIACINNIGPGFGMVGATGNYSAFSEFSKIVLSFDMLVGRLEVYPMLILFIPSVWRKV
jgi:trk system potassium uptake protein TrkH